MCVTALDCIGKNFPYRERILPVEGKKRAKVFKQRKKIYLFAFVFSLFVLISSCFYFDIEFFRKQFHSIVQLSSPDRRQELVFSAKSAVHNFFTQSNINLENRFRNLFSQEQEKSTVAVAAEVFGKITSQTDPVAAKKTGFTVISEFLRGVEQRVDQFLVRQRMGVDPPFIFDTSPDQSLMVFAARMAEDVKDQFYRWFDADSAELDQEPKKPPIAFVVDALDNVKKKLHSFTPAPASLPAVQQSIVLKEPEPVQEAVAIQEAAQPLAAPEVAVEESLPAKKGVVVPAKIKRVTKVKLLKDAGQAEDEIVEEELSELPENNLALEDEVVQPPAPVAPPPAPSPPAPKPRPGKRVAVVLSDSKSAKKKRKIVEQPAELETAQACEPTPVNLRWNPWPLPKLISIRHVEGTNNGVAYATNYSTLAVLSAPDYKPGSFLPMLDLRVHRFDDTSWATNAGLIGRYIPNQCDPSSQARILGVNAYYDWRQTNLGYFQELGGGLEVLGRRWDLRANMYFPFGRLKDITGCDLSSAELASQRRNRKVTYAFNAEVGWLAVDTSQFLLYTAADIYYISRSTRHKSPRGGMFRLRPQYREYLALDLMGSYDPVFKTLWQAEITLYLPLYTIGEPSSRGPYGISNRQVYQPVERFEILPLAKYECW